MRLHTLNPEYGISLGRNRHPDHGMTAVVFVHSPGMGYAFDSTNTGLDSPAAAQDMLTALGLHPVRDPFQPAPLSDHWCLLLDRPYYHDDPRPSELRGPHPIAPIGPISSSGHIEDLWRDAACINRWTCQLLFVAGVPLQDLTSDRVPEALVTAASEYRVAGATITVHP